MLLLLHVCGQEQQLLQLLTLLCQGPPGCVFAHLQKKLLLLVVLQLSLISLTQYACTPEYACSSSKLASQACCFHAALPGWVPEPY